jgi:hypothetical protein
MCTIPSPKLDSTFFKNNEQYEASELKAMALDIMSRGIKRMIAKYFISYVSARYEPASRYLY